MPKHAANMLKVHAKGLLKTKSNSRFQGKRKRGHTKGNQKGSLSGKKLESALEEHLRHAARWNHPALLAAVEHDWMHILSLTALCHCFFDPRPNFMVPKSEVVLRLKTQTQNWTRFCSPGK